LVLQVYIKQAKTADVSIKREQRGEVLSRTSQQKNSTPKMDRRAGKQRQTSQNRN